MAPAYPAASPAGVDPRRRGIIGQVQAAAEAQDPNLSWRDIVDRGYVIAGSPATVIDRLTEVVTNLNVGHLMVLLQFGSMGREVTMENSERFAADVLPK